MMAIESPRGPENGEAVMKKLRLGHAGMRGDDAIPIGSGISQNHYT
jgi:hypothetical protein